MKRLHSKANSIRLLLLCLVPVALAAGILLLPEIARIRCPFYRYLGILCPGCGLTRASMQLVRGHILESVMLNPVALLCLILGGLLYVEQWAAFFGKRLHLLPRTKWFYIALVALLALYWVLRNVPTFAFLSIA